MRGAVGNTTPSSGWGSHNGITDTVKPYTRGDFLRQREPAAFPGGDATQDSPWLDCTHDTTATVITLDVEIAQPSKFPLGIVFLYCGRDRSSRVTPVWDSITATRRESNNTPGQ